MQIKHKKHSKIILLKGHPEKKSDITEIETWPVVAGKVIYNFSHYAHFICYKQL